MDREEFKKPYPPASLRAARAARRHLSDAFPRLFTTEGEESFARRSIRDRHAATLLQVIELNQRREPFRSRLLDFRRESLGGKLTDPFARPGLGTPGSVRTARAGRLAAGHPAPQVGRSWYELPWYFAESFWFLKLLFAFGYYEPAGPNRLRDPFEPFKRRELLQPGGGLEAASGLGPLLAGPAAAAAPRGRRSGRAPAGQPVGQPHGPEHARPGPRVPRATSCASEHELLVDHSRVTARRLLAARRVDLILDNAGPELVCDLLLAARLLAGEEPRQVVLHAKRSPFYVSDARPADIQATIRALAGGADPGGAGGRDPAGSPAGRGAAADCRTTGSGTARAFSRSCPRTCARSWAPPTWC